VPQPMTAIKRSCDTISGVFLINDNFTAKNTPKEHLDALDNRTNALPHTNTHGRQTYRRVALLHNIQQSSDNTGT